MSFLAGSICKFNCCQNGRDLPEGNKKVYKNGKMEYSAGCPHHYFLILSSLPYNGEIHGDFSLRKDISEPFLKKDCKLCIALPIDKQEDIKNKEKYSKVNQIWIPFNANDDIIEVAKKMEDIQELKYLRNNPGGAIICHNLCKLNISKAVSDNLGLMLPEKFAEVITKVNLFLDKSKKELENNSLFSNRK